MPEDGPFADAEAKPAKKSNWRGKLFSKDKSNKHTTDEQVDDFLGTSRPKQQQYQQQQYQAQHLPPPPSKPSKPADSLDDFFQRSAAPSAPRVDVSVSRWPEQHNPSSNSPHSPADAVPFLGGSMSPPKKKKPRRHGLKVAFSDQPPEIIGHGGDETPVPPQDITLYRLQSRSPTLPSLEPQNSSSSYEDAETSHGNNRFDGSAPDLFANESTDPNGQISTPSSVQNTQDADFLYTMGMEPGSRSLSVRESDGSNSFSKRIQARMRAEEGRALQKGVVEPPSPSVGGPSELQRQQNSLPLPTAQSSSPLSLPPENITANLNVSTTSLRSTPTPVTYEQSKPARLDTNIPSHSMTSGTTPPPYLRQGSMDSGQNPQSSNHSLPLRENHHSPDPVPPKKSLRSVAGAVGDSALTDFAAHVDKYNRVFELAAESVKPVMETSLSEWTRSGTWWFIKGRSVLEEQTRSRSSGSIRVAPSSARSSQAVVDLAKSFWINRHIIPQHPELARYGNMSTEALLAAATATGDDTMANLISLHQGILSNLRALALSMKRNNLLPSSTEPAALDQSIDTTIWLRYPFFAPDVTTILAGSKNKSMLVDRSAKAAETAEMMPMGDTSRYFNYGRMFVDVYLSSSDDDSQQYTFPCVMSIVRDRADWYVIAAIASQNELVNIMIQPDKKKGPTWDDVEWQVKSFAMQVRLPRGFELDIQFKEADFKMIWNIVKYTRKTEESLHPGPGETMIFENILKVFQYIDDEGKTKAFPADISPRCRIRLFEKSVIITEGTGKRSAHRGFRIAVVTSPKVKVLSSVQHSLGSCDPIVFGYLRGENGAPALLLSIREEGRKRTMLMTFHELEERTRLHSLLLGVVANEEEMEIPDIPMQSFSIEEPAIRAQGKEAVSHIQFSTPSATVINIDPRNLEHGFGSTVLSENLRVFVNSDWGSVTDRVNLGPGELKISLDMHFPTSMSIYRPPQQDLTVSVAENLVRSAMVESLKNFLHIAASNPTIRNYTFSSLGGLHKFQEAVTGFKVLFDGVASNFAISRRRMVVPIYKKWEANGARIQIIQQEKTVQLLAFFSDFSHGKCMNFALKSTDIFETFTRPGKFAIKIVDAKFALPKSPDDDAAGFVCLDMPDYPGEHDDITLMFDDERDRRNLESKLPGTIKEASRMGSLRK
ncbi:hypothetical protein FQN54_005524 [Arachnomyces sp. PD_36]|nr:hypothetical protein FQN54_005524 [Arachnomyces sp. PD_36]